MPLKNRLYQFLRKTERYTQTDMVYLVKGGFWLTSGQIVSTLASFLLAIAFANLLDIAVYGYYKYILSLTGILVIFTLPGIGTALTQATARNLEGSFYTGFKTKLKFGTLSSLAAVILAGYYFFQGNYTLPIPLLIVAVFFPLMQSSQIYGSFLAGRKLFKTATKYNVLSQILSVGALITALFFTKNLFLLIAIYFISNTSLNYFFYLFTKIKFRPKKNEDLKTLAFGRHLSLMEIIGVVASYIDGILVFHYLGAIELAVYSFAIAPPEQIKGFLKSIQTLALPKFAQKTKEEIRATIFKKNVKLFFFLLLIVCLYILIAPFLYKIFFPKYLEAVFYSQIFSVSLLAYVIFLPLTALQSQMATKKLYKINTYGSLVQILLLFLFVYFFGLLGAILAKVISRFIGVALTFWFAKKI